MRLPPLLLLLITLLAGTSRGLLAEDRFRVAVSPFENIAHEKTLDYLSAGFSEAITTGLFQIPGLLVVERQGLDRVLKEQALGATGLIDEESAVKIGHLVGANYMLTGRYQVAANQIRVFCRLVNVETGEISKNHSFQVTGTVDHIFALQDDLVAKVASSFGVQVQESARKRVARVNRDFSKDRRAFELYVQARQEFFLSTPESYEQAIKLYIEALKINKDFPLAWAGLSSAYLYWGFERSWNGQSYKEYYANALKAALHSVELAPDLSETHTALALVYAYWLPDPRREEAEAEANRAIGLNANNAEAYFAISKARQGDIAYLKKTIALNPQYILAYNWLGVTLQRQNNFAAAIPMHETSIRLNPKWALEYVNLANCYYEMGRYAEAMEKVNRAIELKPDLKGAHVLKSMIQQKIGR